MAYHRGAYAVWRHHVEMIIWLSCLFQLSHAIWLALFLLGSSAIFLIADLTKGSSITTEYNRFSKGMVWLSLTSSLILIGVLVRANYYAITEWVLMGLLGLVCFILARLKRDYLSLAYSAVIITAVFLLGGLIYHHGAKTTIPVMILLFGIFYAGISYLFIRNSIEPHRWAMLSSLTAIIYSLLAYWAHNHVQETIACGHYALLIAGIYAILAIPMAARNESDPHKILAFSSIAATGIIFITAAIPLELNSGWIASAWALETVAILWIEKQYPSKAFQQIAAVPIMLVMYKLMFRSEIIKHLYDNSHVLERALYFYGIPVLLFAIGAYLSYLRKEIIVVHKILLWCSLMLISMLVVLEVRLIFHQGKIAPNFFGLMEWGILTSAWLVLGLLLLTQYKRFAIPDFCYQGYLMISIASVQAFFILALARNPVLNHEAIEPGFLFNNLVIIYGIPALLFIIPAMNLHFYRNRLFANFMSGMGIFLLFILLTLEIRSIFHRVYLDTGATSNAEVYAYSLAWLLFGTSLLLLGVLRKNAMLRYFSLPVIALVTAKVFLYDASHLKDLYRMLSFLELGILLPVLAYIYQKSQVPDSIK